MKKIVLALCLVPIGGCLNEEIKPEPSKITLVNAMKEVGEGLNAMRKAQGDVRTGLIAESAEVTFTITADSKDGGALKVDLSAPALSQGIGVAGEASTSASSGRTNTVTVKFKNLLALPRDTIGYAVAKAQVEGLEPDSPEGAKAIELPSGIEQFFKIDSSKAKRIRMFPDDITDWSRFENGPTIN